MKALQQLIRILVLVAMCHSAQSKNDQENSLQVESPPWKDLAWPPALNDTLECEGTSYCYKKGEKGSYDCNNDRDCLEDGAGTWCWEDCQWDSESWFELGGADCCAYDPGFQDSSRTDLLIPASDARQKSCADPEGHCGRLCAVLKPTACGVVSEEGYVECFPDFHPATDSGVYFPTIDMSENAWFPDPEEVFFKLRPVVSFGLHGVPACSNGASSPEIRVSVTTHVVLAYVTQRQFGCRQRSADYLSWLNKAVLVDETLQWGWTGQWKSVTETSSDGDTSERTMVGCAIEKALSKSVTVGEGEGEHVILECSDVLSEEACSALHMNDGTLYDTEVDDFSLKLVWTARKNEAGTALVAGLTAVVCIEQSDGSCSDSWSSSRQLFADLEIALDGPCAEPPSSGQQGENLCGVQIKGNGTRPAPPWASVLSLLLLLSRFRFA